MKARILDSTGLVVLYIDAPEDQVEINVPAGGSFEVIPDSVELLSLPVRPPPESPP